MLSEASSANSGSLPASSSISTVSGASSVVSADTSLPKSLADTTAPPCTIRAADNIQVKVRFHFECDLALIIIPLSCFNSQSVISQSLTCQQHADCDLPHVSGGYRFLSARHCRSFSCLQFISPPIEVGESLLYLVKVMSF